MASLRERVQRLGGSSYVHLLAITVFVQGVPVLAQLGASKLIAPAEFGQIRVAESILATALVLGALGMPTLAVREIALARTGPAKVRQMDAVLRIAVTAGIATAIIITLGQWALHLSGLPTMLFGLVWLIAITNSARCMVNFFVGVQRPDRISRIMGLCSLIGLPVILLSAHFAGTRGWIAGRFASEITLLIGIGLATLALRKTLRDEEANAAAPAPSAPLVRQGAMVSANLVLRSAADNAPVVLLPLLGVAAQDVGAIAFLLLITSAMMLLPGTAAGIALPRLVEAMRDGTSKSTVDNVMRRQTLLGILCGVSAVLVHSTATATVVPAYAVTFTAVVVASLTIVARSLSVMFGAALTATGHQSALLVVNGLGLVLIAGACVIGYGLHGTAGFLLGLVAAECAFLAAIALLYRASTRDTVVTR